MITKQMIEDAKKLAEKEIRQFGHPMSLDFINNVGQELSKKLKADKKIVMLGTLLMDLKLGESLHKNKWNKHVEMSVKETEKFLKRYKLSKKEKDKIINCVEAHHKTVPFKSLEAEICCNADCYRFLSPKKFLKAYVKRAKEGLEFNKINDFMEEKIDEKMNNLTLGICKKELTPYYMTFKDLIKKAREK